MLRFGISVLLSCLALGRGDEGVCLTSPSMDTSLFEAVDNWRANQEWDSIRGYLKKLSKDGEKAQNKGFEHTLRGEQALYDKRRNDALKEFAEAHKQNPALVDPVCHLAFLESFESGVHLTRQSARNSLRYLRKLRYLEKSPNDWTNGSSLQRTPHRWTLLFNAVVLKGAVNLKLSRFDDAFDGYKEAWELLKSSVEGSNRAFDSDKTARRCIVGMCRMMALHRRDAYKNVEMFRDFMTSKVLPFRSFSVSLEHCILSRFAAVLLRHIARCDYDRAEPLQDDEQRNLFVPSNLLEEVVLVLRLHLKLSSLSKHKLLRSENELYVALSQAEKWAEIAETLRKSVSISLENIPLWYKLGLSLMSAGQHPEALLAFKQCIAARNKQPASASGVSKSGDSNANAKDKNEKNVFEVRSPPGNLTGELASDTPADKSETETGDKSSTGKRGKSSKRSSASDTNKRSHTRTLTSQNGASQGELDTSGGGAGKDEPSNGRFSFSDAAEIRVMALLMATKLCVNHLSKTKDAVVYAEEALELVISHAHSQSPNSSPSSSPALQKSSRKKPNLTVNVDAQHSTASNYHKSEKKQPHDVDNEHRTEKPRDRDEGASTINENGNGNGDDALLDSRESEDADVSSKQTSRRGRAALRRVVTLDQSMMDTNQNAVRRDETNGDALLDSRESEDADTSDKQTSRRGRVALRRVVTLDQSMTDTNPNAVRRDETLKRSKPDAESSSAAPRRNSESARIVAEARARFLERSRWRNHEVTAQLALGVACASHAFNVSSFSARKRLQQQALTSLQRALKLSERNPMVAFHLAAVYADIREIRNAIRMVHHALSLKHTFAPGWHLLALLLSSEQKYDHALKAIDDAIELEPSNPRLLLTKARIYKRMGSFRSSIKVHHSLAATVFRTDELSTVKVDLKGLTFVNAERASQFASTSKPHIHPTNVAQSPTYTSPNPNEKISPRKVYEDSLRRMDSVGLKAMRAITTRGRDSHQTATLPVFNTPLYYRGDEKCGEGEEKEVELGFNYTASDESVSSPNPAFESLKSSHKNDDPNALKFEILLSLSSMYTEYGALELHEHAFGCALRALELARATKAAAWFPDVHAQLGIICESTGQLDVAVRHFDNALAFNSVHTKSLTRLGAVENKRGNFVLAHGNLSSSLRIDSTQHDAWHFLGEVRSNQHNFEVAAEAFLTSLELERSTPVEEFFNVQRHL